MKSFYFLIFISFFIVIIAIASSFIVNTIRMTLPSNSQPLASYIWIPFVVFPIILIGLMTISNIVYVGWLREIYFITMLWLPFLTYLFIASIVFRIYIVAGPVTQIIPTQIVALCLALLVCSVMIFGVWRATHYKIVTQTITAPTLRELWSDKKIVLFSDSHIGLARGKHFMQTIATTITNLSPDIVFIAGDLIDGPVFPYERDLSPLQNIKSTYGTYYTAGNHDEYNREQQQYQQALEQYVTILNDKRIIVNNTQIVGILFASETLEATKNRLESTGFDKTIPSIALLHDPKNTQTLVDAGVSLSLSGHTHGGQFWPFSILLQSMYRDLTKGITYRGEHAHVTTVGVGTWGPLFRLGTVPEIVVLKIQ